MQYIQQTLNSIPSLPTVSLTPEERALIQQRTAIAPRDKVLCLCPDCVDNSAELIRDPSLISDARDWIKPRTSAAHHHNYLQHLAAQERTAALAAPANKLRCLTLDDYSGILEARVRAVAAERCRTLTAAQPLTQPAPHLSAQNASPRAPQGHTQGNLSMHCTVACSRQGQQACSWCSWFTLRSCDVSIAMKRSVLACRCGCSARPANKWSKLCRR